MKKQLYPALIVLVCLSACKKDDGDDTPSGAIPYVLSAPKCLPANIKIQSGNDVSTNTYQYDNQKRLIGIFDPVSLERSTYTYNGNMMVEENTYEDSEGQSHTDITTNYLNKTGFVSRSIDNDSNQTIYTYDNQGYLIREISMSFGRYQSGVSYQYANGNRQTSYDLSLDWETGNVTDSTLSASYFYYENMPGKMEDMESWLSRLGRGSRNELKSINGGFSTSAYEYTVGSNGMPSSAIYTYIFGEVKIDFEWACN